MIETFITAHSPALVRKCARSGKFSGLNHRYVLLGPNDDGDLPAATIISRRQPLAEAERYPNWLSYRTYHLLLKNDLFREPYFVHLHYDHDAPADLERQVLPFLAAAPNVYIGFQTLPLSDVSFLGIPEVTRLIRDCLSEYGVTVEQLLARDETNTWVTCGAGGMSVDYLRGFWNWIVGWSVRASDHRFVAHAMERLEKFYSLYRGFNEKYLLNVVAHRHSDGHGTTAEVKRTQTLGL